MNAALPRRALMATAAAVATAGLLPGSRPVMAQANSGAGGGTGTAANRTVQVPAEGSVNADNDKVEFSGAVAIESRVIQDTVFMNPDVLEMVIDFSGLRGIGRTSRQAFETEALVIVRRPLLPFDEFEVTFPYARGRNPNSAQTAVVRIAVVTAPGQHITFDSVRVREF